MNELLVICYGITIVASAVAGSYLPALIRMTHVRMQLILSFVGGLMLGVAVLTLLPHSLQMSKDHNRVMQAMLIGLLVTFLMMRAFRFHQHGDEENDHRHDHDAPRRPTRLSWLGVIFGLSLHTFVDGLALGAAVMADIGHGAPWPPFGFSVYLAILLHKPLDALTVSTLMQAEGWSRPKIQAANACFTLMCPIGALCVVMGGQAAKGETLAILLAAAAGVFLCISLSDLLPEVQFHQHDRVQLSAALLLGIAMAYGMEMLHTHPNEVQQPTSEHHQLPAPHDKIDGSRYSMLASCESTSGRAASAKSLKRIVCPDIISPT